MITQISTTKLKEKKNEHYFHHFPVQNQDKFLTDLYIVSR